MVAGIGPQQREGLHHLDPGVLGDDALGLFDDDAAVERIGELFVEGAQVKVCAVVEYREAGNVSEALCRIHVGFVQQALVGLEQAQRPMVCFRRRMGRA